MYMVMDGLDKAPLLFKYDIKQIAITNLKFNNKIIISNIFTLRP